MNLRQQIINRLRMPLPRRRDRRAKLTVYSSPSLPMASTGHPSIASVHAAISYSEAGCLLTKE